MDTRRYHGLDALRGMMMMLGIVLHGAQFYVADPPIPVPTDPDNSHVFTFLILFIHSFRMPVFFVLAGFFASLLMEKYGLRGSLVNRGKRVAAPLLLALLTILPVTGWLVLSFLISAASGEQQLLTRVDQLAVLDVAGLAAAGIRPEPSPGHLWFLYYLLWFYLTLPLCRGLLAWTARRGFGPGLDAMARSAWLLPGLALWTAVTLLPFRNAVVLEGFVYFTPHLPSMLYYGTFFMLGYAFHHHRGLLDACSARLPQTSLIAAVSFPLALWASALDLAAAGSDAGVHLLAAGLHGIATWALVFAFIGAALRWLDHDSPWILYISRSSYWVYLVHMPAVTLMAWLLLPLSAPALLKYLIVVTVASLLCFTSYHHLVRRSWISVLLNGRTFEADWPWRERTAPRGAQPG